MRVGHSRIASPPDSDDDLYWRIATEVCRERGAFDVGWQLKRSDSLDGGWIRVHHQKAASRDQGWKIHVSANLTSAAHVLRAILPALLSAPLTFKIAGSPRKLARLNRGQFGLSQVGKFVTIYPNNDEQAVSVAGELRHTTTGLAGPEICSDRQLNRGSLVHYRYGVFRGRLIQIWTGEVVGAIVNPSGGLVPDRRLSEYAKPDWAQDPFLEAGLSEEPGGASICGNYYVLGPLHRRAESRVDLAIDLSVLRLCILKRAHYHSEHGTDRRNAVDRLRHEREILKRLASVSYAPSVYETFDHQNNACMAIEEFKGETLEQYLTREALNGRIMRTEIVVIIGRQLASILSDLHKKGLVHRDLTARNVIIDDEWRLHLLDFEMAYDTGGVDVPFGVGTRGHYSPQQAALERPNSSDDIYSLGAVLYHMATGANPALVPNQWDLLARPVELMNLAVAQPLVPIIARCLEPDPAMRFNTAEEVGEALSRITEPVEHPLRFGEGSELNRVLTSPEEYRNLARRLTDSICAQARPTPDSRGLAWMSSHPAARGWAHRSLSLGSAGTVLALAELVAELRDRDHERLLRDGADWLLRAPRVGGFPVPGLYVGEAGVAAALLRTGQVLGDHRLVREAADRSLWIATLPHESPDIFNGSAGRLRFHLLIWDATHNDAHLRAAVDAGELLLASALFERDGETRWKSRASGSDTSEMPLLGYAHGAAGIADALLDLFEVVEDTRLLRAVEGVVKWLNRTALPALQDESGLEWPHCEGGRPSGGTWCHGAAGVGHFLAHASRSGLSAEAPKLASSAARMVARGARWRSPVLCHGLAGQIEFLLDLFQATGNYDLLAEADSLCRILRASAIERQGHLYWPGDDPDIHSPDYMVGYAGIAVVLLRLIEPHCRPRQLTRQGFQREQ